VSRPDVILMDLDGTITDSIPGIFRCLRQALPVLGLEDIDDDELRTWLGPPLRVTVLERYGRSEEELDAFVTAYRAQYFGGGEYEFTVFPGMAALIRDIGASDTRLVLATAKPIESAERVLSRADLIGCFDFVSGTELDLMRQDKPSIIAHGVESIGLTTGAVQAVVVGDRREDVLGARFHGFAAIGVRWGYADEGELEAAEADHLVSDVDELRARLGF
jgi:phosphoglycolate phosphatase